MCWDQVPRLNNTKLLITPFLALLNVFIVAGNSLIILAIFRCRNLRQASSQFIISLAVADLGIGILVLPFSAANEAFTHFWIFGGTWCKLWLMIDVFLCTASIYNLVGISIDRLVAVTKPLYYKKCGTSSRKRIAVACVWGVSFLISFPPMVSWPSEAQLNGTANHSAEEPCHCTPMNNSPDYIIYSSLGSFFIPMAIIACVYGKIFMVVRGVSLSNTTGLLKLRKGMLNNEPAMRVHRGGTKTTPLPSPSSPSRLPKQGPNLAVQSTSLRPESSQKSESGDHDISKEVTQSPGEPRATEYFVGMMVSLLSTAGGPKTSIRSRFRGFMSSKGKLTEYQTRFAAELRAAKTLAVVTGVFILCWLGFAVCYFLRAFPFCHADGENDCIPPQLFSLVFWLGYANSACNPIIYPLCNHDFRQTFWSILCCRFKNGKRQNLPRMARL